MAFPPPHNNPHDQYLLVRALRQTQGQVVVGQVTLCFEAWDHSLKDWKSTARSANTQMVLILSSGGEPLWREDYDGNHWCPALLLCYGTAPPSLDGSRSYRFLKLGPDFTSNPCGCTVRTGIIVNQKGHPHPELGR